MHHMTIVPPGSAKSIRIDSCRSEVLPDRRALCGSTTPGIRAARRRLRGGLRARRSPRNRSYDGFHGTARQDFPAQRSACAFPCCLRLSPSRESSSAHARPVMKPTGQEKGPHSGGPRSSISLPLSLPVRTPRCRSLPVLPRLRHLLLPLLRLPRPRPSSRP